MERARLIPAGAALLLALFSGAVLAAGQGPCAADAEKFCKGVAAGEGRIARCLNQHEQELAPACQEQIAKAKQKVSGFEQACKEDASRLCKGVRPGGGRIVQCLKSHEQELSPACQSKMKRGS